MGKRGTKPLPLQILKLRGTFRPSRHGTRAAGAADVKVAKAPGVPRPPTSLTPGAKKEWRRLAKEAFALGILTQLDLQALEGYAIARDRALESERELARDGRTIKTPMGLRRHPANITAEKAWADCRRYEALFGMTPSARRGLNMTEAPPLDTAAAAKRERYFGSGA